LTLLLPVGESCVPSDDLTVSCDQTVGRAAFVGRERASPARL